MRQAAAAGLAPQLLSSDTGMLVRMLWFLIIVLCIMVVRSMLRGVKQLLSLRMAQAQ
jgi:hypothetical protein